MNLAEDKIQVSDSVKNEMQQLWTDRKLSLSLQFPYALSSTHSQIAFLNTRSLHKHIDEVKHDFGLLACDVCTFCETRLMLTDIHKNTDRYNLTDYTLSAYEGSVFSDDSRETRSHYGLAVYSRLQVERSFQAIKMTTVLQVECVVTQVALKPDITLNVVNLYRQNSTNLLQFKHAIEIVKQHLYNIRRDACQQYTVIMGDFNLNWFEKSTQELMSNLLPNFKQLIESPTTDYNSLLDHIYSDLPSDSVMCYTTECYYSDHKPVVCAVRL